MSLLEELQRARTEEDVKDAYIKALGLKGVFKGLVDIQTAEIWFEAKEAPAPPLLMFACETWCCQKTLIADKPTEKSS